MIKKRITIAAMMLMSTGGALADQVVNLYSQRHYPADKEVFALFTEKTGIKVNVVTANADELIKRLQSEGEKSPADVLLTKDAARLYWAESLGLYQPVKSATLEKNVPASLRDPEMKWFGFTQRARVLVYAKDRVKAEELKTYEDLTKPEWKGRIVARSASHVYNQSLLSSIIATQGEKEALLWAVKVRQNMARKPKGSDRDQIRAVASGLADVAIVNSYYLGVLTHSEDPKDRELAGRVKMAFPNQEGRGTHVNISGIGVCKYAKNKENAIKFIEFLSSKEVQELYPAKTYEYPLSLEMITPLHKSWGSFKPDTLNLKALGENNTKAIKMFQAAKWE